VAGRHGLAVVEDAAHALGATYRGRPVGAISRFTAFSFQAIKHLTTGDGGALCCAAEEDARAALVRRWFGIDRANSRPSILGEREYDIDAVGFKYHLNDLAASVGLGNIEDFPGRLARRRALAARYREALAGVPGLRLLRCPPDRESAWWLFTIRVERREDFIRALASRGVPASVVHLRIDRNSVFGGVRDDLPGQAAFDADQVSLPVHEGLSDEDVGTVVAAVRAGW
jgi:perosamine synthetase